MAVGNERMRWSERAVIGGLAIVLGTLLWVSWQVRDTRPEGPIFSGETIEYVKTKDGKDHKIILQIYVGDTEEQWTQRLREKAKGLETFDE